jgi:predicted RNA binding protein YcfA (HicA-like mRNA interferase family)
MVQGYYHQLIAILKQEAGAYYVKNTKGSHERWNTADGTPLHIPRNCPSPFTANAILKDAGLPKRF